MSVAILYDQVFTLESLGVSFALVQAPFLFSVLTSEVVETKMQFITIIFLNQQSKVYYFHFTGLKALVLFLVFQCGSYFYVGGYD